MAVYRQWKWPLYCMILCLVFLGCKSKDSSQTSVQNELLLPPPDTIILSPMDISQELQDQWVDYTQGISIDNKQFIPVDQTMLNPYFAKFMADFYEAIEQRDVDFLLKHLDDQVKMSNSNEQGKDAFIKTWNLDMDPYQSEIWKQLDDVFALGGIFTNIKLNSYIAPYTFFLQLDNPSRQKVVTGTEVRIRNTPGVKGDILGLLSHEVVSLVPLGNDEELVYETIEGETYPWEKVQTTYGTIGYIYGKYLRSTRDFRINLVYQNGTWKISYLIAGD